MSQSVQKRKSLYFKYPEYAFIRPAELDGHRQRHPVIIIGAGPVGVTAALELARHGINSIVLDDKSTVSEGSKAICIARHSMECLQQIGLAEKFEHKALPWTHGTSYYHDKEVYRLEMPHSDAERFYPMYNLQQPYIEQYLVDEAMANPLIDLRWQNRVTDLRQDENSVDINVQTPEGDYVIRSDFALAADGARSVARHKLGLKLHGDTYEGRYVIADIQMKSDYPTERRAFFDSLSNPGLTILIHKQPENIWRIDYQIDENMDADEETREENIRARIISILDMIGETAEWKLEWWSIYKAYTLALDDYRHKKILFLGDAAHLVPIFGVRGLNSGIADAMNAAWKLAYVIHGWADEKLLDSYSPERRGATLDVFENASKSTKFMTPPSRGHQLMRDAALSLAISHDFTRPLINPRQSQPYTYIDSALSSYRHRDAEFTGGPGAGAPIFSQGVGDTNYLLDYIGQGFSGLYFTNTADIPAEVLKLSDTLSVGEEKFTLIVISQIQFESRSFMLIYDEHGEIFSNYDAVNGSFYLIRPDRHVLARWKHINTDEVMQAFTRCLRGGESE
ncbi:MAG: 3-(3-hydroxy-phenyl)propionate hydroxylase [Gammaproteobacteria bacterium]|jgi:3-(3-hydroxy-phenyl)propionate hydroxylase